MKLAGVVGDMVSHRCMKFDIDICNRFRDIKIQSFFGLSRFRDFSAKFLSWEDRSSPRRHSPNGER